MSPLGMYLIYCDHGFPVGGDCWRCWQRRALEAEADVRALAKAGDVMSLMFEMHWTIKDTDEGVHDAVDNWKDAISRPTVRKIVEVA